MKSLIRTCLCVAVCLTFSVSASQLYGQVVYTITGFTGGFGAGDPSISPEVASGESYVAEFVIDPSVPDTDSRSDRGEYPGAILSSSIEFSGGYTSQFDFAGGDITVFNDAVSGGGIFFFPTKGAGGIVIYDLLNPFESDALFTDPGSQITGSTNSLGLFPEPSGSIFSFSASEFGLEGTFGPMQLSVTLGTPIILGDCDLDGAVTFSDVPVMVSTLTTGDFLPQADCNEDNVVNFQDVPSFIDILRGQ